MGDLRSPPRPAAPSTRPLSRVPRLPAELAARLDSLQFRLHAGVGVHRGDVRHDDGDVVHLAALEHEAHLLRRHPKRRHHLGVLCRDVGKGADALGRLCGVGAASLVHGREVRDLVGEHVVKEAVGAHDDNVALQDRHAEHGGRLGRVAHARLAPQLEGEVEVVLLLGALEDDPLAPDDDQARVAQVGGVHGVVAHGHDARC
mmetsp:Transcript_47482/g.121200  ORF Transcript_47482/g.121200 Transcript_47482/m.121200 type:complete len:202 (-) Transcript_47482:1014-1619(-)